MSKRKLLRLVKDNLLSGWDDPRMPTLAGFRRRGVRPEAIRQFCDIIGVAKANSMVDVQMLEFAIRDDLNTEAPRVMCVIDPIKVTLTNYPAGTVEMLPADNFPHDIGKPGSREMPFSKNLFIERSDFAEVAPKKWKRLAPGVEVRLRQSYAITCDEVIKDADGKVVELKCSYDAETKSGGGGRKVKGGVIHWVCADHALDVEVRLYDRLFKVEKPDAAEGDLVDHLNPDSLKIVTGAKIEPAIANDPSDTRYQFERTGYFWRDPVDSTESKLVFNRIVALRDSWSKENSKPADSNAKKGTTTKPETPAAKANKPVENKHVINPTRQAERDANPALAAAFDAYQSFGLGIDEADVLTGDAVISSYFDTVRDGITTEVDLGVWIVNVALPLLGEKSIADIPPTETRALFDALASDNITNKGSKTAFEAMVAGEGTAAAVIEKHNLAKIKDPAKIGEIVDAVISDNPKQTEAYRGGKQSLFGFFIGQVMKRTGSAADPEITKQVLQERL